MITDGKRPLSDADPNRLRVGKADISASVLAAINDDAIVFRAHGRGEIFASDFTYDEAQRLSAFG